MPREEQNQPTTLTVGFLQALCRNAAVVGASIAAKPGPRRVAVQRPMLNLYQTSTLEKEHARPVNRPLHNPNRTRLSRLYTAAIHRATPHPRPARSTRPRSTHDS
jgi:hypothetical protein